MVLQHDAIPLQYHQWLSVQGCRTGPGPLGYGEAQLSSIGGHLSRGGHRFSVGDVRSGHVLAILLMPCLSCSSDPPTMSPRKLAGRLQK